MSGYPSSLGSNFSELEVLVYTDDLLCYLWDVLSLLEELLSRIFLSLLSVFIVEKLINPIDENKSTLNG
jgi:hypothetical protein